MISIIASPVHEENPPQFPHNTRKRDKEHIQDITNLRGSILMCTFEHVIHLYERAASQK